MRPPPPPGHPVAAPARMDEGDVHRREPRHDVGLDEGRVEPLIGDAVAVEDDPVAILDRERPLGPQRREQTPRTKPRPRTARPASLIRRVIARPLRGRCGSQQSRLIREPTRTSPSHKINQQEPVGKILSPALSMEWRSTPVAAGSGGSSGHLIDSALAQQPCSPSR